MCLFVLILVTPMPTCRAMAMLLTLAWMTHTQSPTRNLVHHPLNARSPSGGLRRSPTELHFALFRERDGSRSERCHCFAALLRFASSPAIATAAGVSVPFGFSTPYALSDSERSQNRLPRSAALSTPYIER